MGGNAFDDLLTPRIPSDIYYATKTHIETQLKRLFRLVTSPIEGPEKTDHGDIDIIVAGLLNPLLSQDMWEEISLVIDAVEIIRKSPTSANIAVRWPTLHLTPPGSFDMIAKSPLIKPVASEALNVISESHTHPAFIQVDVSIMSSDEAFHWSVFRYSHGDFWKVLGWSIKSSGIVAGEDGLYLRIRETRHISHKKSKVLMSSDPHETLKFLGLPYDESFWEKPFDSDVDLFNFIAKGTFFYVSANDSESKLEDYKRVRNRHCFQRFVNEYLPMRRDQDLYHQSPKDFDEVMDMAVQAFGERVRTEFEATRDSMLDKHAKEIVRREVKRRCNEFDGLDKLQAGMVISTVKKIVLDHKTDMIPPGLTFPKCLTGPPRNWDLDNLWEWMKAHWTQILEHRLAMNSLGS